MELTVDCGGELTVDCVGDHPHFTSVTKHVCGRCGLLIDTAIMYEVEYADGSKQLLAANVNAKHLFSSVDKEGYRHLHLPSSQSSTSFIERRIDYLK